MNIALAEHLVTVAGFSFSGSHPKMTYFTNQDGGETVNISPGKIQLQSYFTLLYTH